VRHSLQALEIAEKQPIETQLVTLGKFAEKVKLARHRFLDLGGCQFSFVRNP